MQRNYPLMFLPADDQDKDGFKLELKNQLNYILVQPFVLESSAINISLK